MVDKSRLQIVGFLFGGMTAIVMVVAALLVTEASALDPLKPSADTAPAIATR